MSGSGRPGESGRCWPGSPAPRGGWSRPNGNGRGRWSRPRAEGISIRTLATAAGLSPSRVHQLVPVPTWTRWTLRWVSCGRRAAPAHVAGITPQTSQLQVALGDRSSCGLFAQDWTGVPNPALLEALQSIQRPTFGPGI